MSYENWKDKIGTFEVMDVRGKKMDFFPALKAKAAALKNGEGLHIIQTFEPVPLVPGAGPYGLWASHGEGERQRISHLVLSSEERRITA